MTGSRKLIGGIALAIAAVVAVILIALALHASTPAVSNPGATPGYVATTAPAVQSLGTFNATATTASTSAAATGAAASTGASGKPVSLWIGDAYTAGVGAASSAEGEACLTATTLGWSCQLDAVTGSGYASGPTPLAGRLANDASRVATPNVVVIDAGRTDGSTLSSTLQSAITSYFTQVAQTWPGANIVVIEPYYLTSATTDFAASRKFIATQAGTHNWSVIDPIGSGWINASSAKLVGSNKIDPTPDGHKYLAGKLATTLKPLATALAK